MTGGRPAMSVTSRALIFHFCADEARMLLLMLPLVGAGMGVVRILCERIRSSWETRVTEPTSPASPTCCSRDHAPR